MGERLLQGLKLRNKREIGDGPRKGNNQLERLELSHTRGRSEGHSKRAGSYREHRETSGRGRSPTGRRHFQAQKTTCGQEEVQCRWPRNRPTVREEQGRDPTILKTRSHSEDHRERKRRRLQGAKRSPRQRLQPHREGSRVRHHVTPETRSKCCGGGHATTTWDREGHWRELRTTEYSRPQRGPPGYTPVVTGLEEKPQTEVRSPLNRPRHLTHMVTKPSFQSRTNKPRPRRGDPITKGVNHRGEENPPGLAEPEQAGGRRTGKKSTNPLVQHCVLDNHRESKTAYRRLITRQQRRPG